MPGHDHSVPVDPLSMCRYHEQGFGADITLVESATWPEALDESMRREVIGDYRER